MESAATFLGHSSDKATNFRRLTGNLRILIKKFHPEISVMQLIMSYRGIAKVPDRLKVNTEMLLHINQPNYLIVTIHLYVTQMQF